MIKITGSHNSAICYTNELEATALSQIQAVCDREDFKDSKIRIMPDVHAGKGCTIGTTMTITDKIVPGMVGVDIGCGMETVKIQEKEIDYEKLDNLIREEIPTGYNIRDTLHPLNDEITLANLKSANHVNLTRASRSIGTLGGGNHFIEVGQAQSGDLYIVVHSGSRHIGSEVAEYYQETAYKTLCGNSQAQIDETIAKLKSEGKHKEIQSTITAMKQLVNPNQPKDLSYVTGELFDDYIHDMKIIQLFAKLNRIAMTNIILEGMGFTAVDRFTTIHNYIDTDTMMLRKGAVSAKKGERLLIPINMRDGSLICEGNGNEDWNNSAPHGAGRIMSRKQAYRELSMDDYQAAMTGIFTTSLNEQTLDESPMAYKKMEEIVENITPTAKIINHVRTTYNFKASE
ncbi:MAG: RtcB family protein [Firmicutes bacterium]|nr:RtcB family protein [Bacillota bacterium]